MALLEKQLFVKRSKLPKSGKGLFTGKLISKGSRIVEYKGVKKRSETVLDKSYAFNISTEYIIDAKNYLDGLAQMANDANGLNKKEGCKNNSCYMQYGMRVYIIATANIPAGEEIFVSYGKKYWNNEPDIKTSINPSKNKRMATAKKTAVKKTAVKKVASKKAAPKKVASKKAAPKKNATTKMGNSGGKGGIITPTKMGKGGGKGGIITPSKMGKSGKSGGIAKPSKMGKSGKGGAITKLSKMGQSGKIGGIAKPSKMGKSGSVGG